MDIDSLPVTESGTYNADNQPEADELRSSGSGRLTWVAAALVVLLGLAYVLSPKQPGSIIPAAAPSFMLEGAAVTATREVTTPAPVPAAPDAAAPVAAPAVAAAINQKMVAAAAPALPATAAGAAAPVAAVAPEPEPAAPSVQAAPAAPAAPASVSLAGRVLNEEGKPLVGATVLLKGSTKGTSTDAGGNYVLEVPAGDNTLLYGYGGYADEEVRARNSQILDVTLAPRNGAKKRR